MAKASSFAQAKVEATAQPDGFHRVIITYPNRENFPSHQVRANNGVLVVGVGSATQFDFSSLEMNLPEIFSSFRSDRNGLGMRMGLREDRKLNVMDAGEALYIDILPLNWEAPLPALPAEVVERLAERARIAQLTEAEKAKRAEIVEFAPAVDVLVGRYPGFYRISFLWSFDTEANYVPQDVLETNDAGGEISRNTAVLGFDWPAEIDLLDIQTLIPPEILQVSAEIGELSSVLSFVFGEGVKPRFYTENELEFILDIAVAEAMPEATIIDEPPVTEITHEADVLSVELGTGGMLEFNFDAPVGSAAYVRGMSLWVFFDTETQITLPENGVDARWGDVRILRLDGRQVMRVTPLTVEELSFYAEGNKWILSQGRALHKPVQPIILERQIRGVDDIAMFAPLPQYSSLLVFEDPEVGDSVNIAMQYGPSFGVIHEIQMVDFTASESLNGLIVLAKSDGLQVIEDEVERGITIARVGKLNITQDILTIADKELSDVGGGQYLMPYLAKFYLSNDFGLEALGAISLTKTTAGASKKQSTQLALMEAAANILAGRNAEAISLLERADLRDDGDATIWRSIASSGMGAYEKALVDVQIGQKIIGSYPQWVQVKFHFAAIKAALEVENEPLAERLLSKFVAADLSGLEQARYNILVGRLAELAGENDRALLHYVDVIERGDRPAVAEASLRVVNVLDKLGRLDKRAAQDVLETQAMVWRGDAIELQTAAVLTRLQFDNGRYREGLTLTQNLGRYYAGRPEMNTMLIQAQERFIGLYRDGSSAAVSELEALSLFYDFRHLVPSGERGDAIGVALAQRLAGVELIDQAAVLLEHQMNERSQGVQKAELATQVARLRLRNDEPLRALQAIDSSRLTGLPRNLEGQRSVLEAEALAKMGRTELALDLVAGMSGEDITRFKAGVLWSGQKYQAAADLLIGSIETLPDMSRENIRKDVLQAAAGYVLANDQMALKDVRHSFGGQFLGSSDEALFEYITQGATADALPFRRLVNELAGREAFEAFMVAYQSNYRANDL